MWRAMRLPHRTVAQERRHCASVHLPPVTIVHNRRDRLQTVCLTSEFTRVARFMAITTSQRIDQGTEPSADSDVRISINRTVDSSRQV